MKIFDHIAEKEQRLAPDFEMQFWALNLTEVNITYLFVEKDTEVDLAEKTIVSIGIIGEQTKLLFLLYSFCLE